MERDGYSNTINNIVLFPWERKENVGGSEIKLLTSLGELPEGTVGGNVIALHTLRYLPNTEALNLKYSQVAEVDSATVDGSQS